MSLEQDTNTCPAPEPFRNHLGVVIFLTLLFLISFLARFIFSPLMPSIEKDLGVTHSQAGSLFMVLSIGFLTAQLGSGFLASRILHRGSIITSAIAMGLFLILFSFLNSLNQIRLVMMLLGMAAGLHLPSAVATITAMIDRQDWGKALGVHQTAPSIALVMGPLLVVALPFSWRTLLLLIGILSIAGGVFFFIFNGSGRFPGQQPAPANVKALLSLKSFWIMVALFSMGIASSAGLYTMIPLYLASEKGFDPDTANFLLGLSRIPGLFIVIVAGWIVDRIGEKKTLSGVLFFSGLGTILLGLASSKWIIPALFLQPFIASGFFPPGFAALSRIVSPNFRSLATSLVVSIGFLLGGGMVPMFLGLMGEKGNFDLGIVLLGAVTGLIPVLTLFLRLKQMEEPGC